MKTTVLNHQVKSETSASDSRSLKKRCGNLALGVMLVVVSAGPAVAGPTGGEIVAGEGMITTNGRLTQIDQATGRIAINWDTFNVATDETVRFVQPGSTSVALNTIFDQNPSQIFGTIEANGRVLLINPNGLIFSPTAQVNVAGLVASSLSISTADFMAGNYTFEDTGAGGMVLNQGTLQAAPGGFIALLGNAVANEGLIVADAGTIAMGAGNKVALDFDGSGLIYFEVESDVLNNALGVDDAVRNSGSLVADGGQVLLTAAAAQDVYTRAINNEGLIQARRIDNQGGVIRLTGGSGTVVSTGVIDATGGDDVSTGGTVEMLGGRVGLLEGGSIDASGATGGGTVHLGGAAHGAGDLTAEFTQVSADASISADARVSGDGGEIIVWADDSTWFYGSASVTGGSESGNGGFVEISGAIGLAYGGFVDATAANGELGTLLFDPDSITIINGAGPGANDGDIPDWDDPNPGLGDFVISEQALETQAGTASITLAATNDITIQDLTDDNTLSLLVPNDGVGGTAGTVTFTAGGTILMEGANDTIVTGGGNLTIDGGVVDIANVDTSGAADEAGGSVNITATGTLTAGDITTSGGADIDDSGGNAAGNVTLAGEDINLGAIAALGSAAQSGTDGADGNVLVNANGSVVVGGNIDVNAGQIDVFVDLDEGTTNGAESLEIQGTLTAGTINLNGGSAQQDDTLIVSLTGADTATWIINAAQSGTLVAGASSIASFFNFSSLTGGAQTDNFTISGTGALGGTAAGGTGTNTITGNDTANTWTLNAAGDGTVANSNGSVVFTGMSSATGGSLGDIFNFGGDFGGNVDGDAGEDEFNLTESQTGLMNGGADADIFNLTAGVSVGGLSGGAGGDNDDTLAIIDADGNPNADNDWVVDGAGSGTVNGQGLQLQAFSEMENLTGNTRDDNFSILLGGSIAGIDGGDGTDAVSYADAARVTGVTVAYDIFTSIESLTGTVHVDTLTGTSGEDTFTLTATGEGSAGLTGGLETVPFVSFENISGQGGIDTFELDGDFGGIVSGDGGADEFNLNVNQSGQFNGGEGSDIFTIANGVVLSFPGAAIAGGAGNDTLNLAAHTNATDPELDTNLTGVDAVNGEGFAGTVQVGGGGIPTAVTNFTGIDTLVGSADGTVTDTLTGRGVDSSWTQTSYNDGTSTLAFSGISTAIGGALGTQTLLGDDDDVDTVDVFTTSGPGLVDLNGQDFENIDAIDGRNLGDTFNLDSGNFGGSIAGNAGGDIFNINGGDAASVSGGAGNDQFLFANGATLTATVAGGAGNDTLNLAAHTNATDPELDTTLTGVDATDGFDGSVQVGGGGTPTTVTNFTGIDTLIGSADGAVTDTLTGRGVDSTWTQTSYNDGTSTLAFSGISLAIGGAVGTQTLQGGAGIDTFTVDGTGSVTLGSQDFDGMDTLSGQGSGDIFNLNADFGGNVNGDGGDDQFNLTASQTGVVDGGADGANGDVINGIAAANAFVINALNGGTANGTTFANVENLNGGAAGDSFTFVGAGALGGSIDGAGGTNSMDVSGADGGVTVNLGNGAATVLNNNAGGGFSNISEFTGDNANDTLIGPNGGATFDTTGINDGTVAGTTYTDFANITGGDGADIFNLNHDVTGTVNGGDDADTFNLAAGVIIGGSIVGGDGGTDDDELVAVGGAGPNAWAVTSEDTGTLNGQAFSDIENLTGNGNVDNFDIDAVVTGTVAGLGGNDVFDFGGATGSAGFVDGGAGTDSMTFANRTTGVTVDMATVDEIESLTGSALDDVINFNGNEANGITINGGGGTDTVAVISSSQIAGDLIVTDVDAVSIGADLDVGVNDISLTVDGAITQSGAGGVLTAQSLTTSTVGGQTLDSAVGTFTASNSGSGDIDLTNTGDLVITSINQTGGSVLIDTDGALSQTGAITASSGVSLAATGEVSQSDDITATGNVSVTTTGGNIVMAEGVVTRSNGGDITYETTGTDADITLANVRTCDDCSAAGSTGDVIIRAADGSIFGYEIQNQNDAHITGYSVSLIAGEDIGTEQVLIKLRRINAQGNASNSGEPIFLEYSGSANVDSEVNIGVALSQNANLEGLNLSTVAVAGQVTADQAATQGDTEEVDWAAYSEDITLYEINNEGVQLPEQEEVDDFAKIDTGEGAVPIARNQQD